MHKIILSNVEIDLYDENTPIGLSLSGGADSAVLAFILMKYSKSPIHFFTLGNKLKNFISVKHSNEVIRTCIALTGNLNITHHIDYAETQEREHFFKLLTDKVDSSLVKVVYTATTNTPPLTEMLKFKNMLDKDLIARRAPNTIKPMFSCQNKIYNPFSNIDKKDIKNLYHDLGLLETLFPLTRSCESLVDFEKHCGECWWCEERLWAFGKLS